MTKKIIEIGSERFGVIAVGIAVGMGVVDTVSNSYLMNYANVEEIIEHCYDEYPPSYFVHFENSVKTLEILDVVYVIRDEVKE